MRFLATAILLFLTCSFASAQQKDWFEFVSDEGGFSVLMPEKPTPDIVRVYTPKGIRESHTFSYSDEDMNSFMVAYSKFRETRAKEIDYELLLDKVQKGILIADEGKLISNIALRLDGNPGREVTIEHNDGSVKTHRFYIAGDFFYQLATEIKKSKGSPRQTERFLNSFKLTSSK